MLTSDSLEEEVEGITGRPVSRLEEILAANFLIRVLSSGEVKGVSWGSAIETTV